MWRWALLLLTTSQYGSKGASSSVTYNGSYEQARATCSREGGRLPLPGDNVTNMDLASQLLTSGISSTWVDAVLYQAQWFTVTDGKVEYAYDQGCYLYSDLVSPASTSDTRNHTACTSTCSQRNYLFGAVSMPFFGSLRCRCLNSTELSRRLAESSCSSACTYFDQCGGNYLLYRTYRVLSTQATDIGDAVTRFRWQGIIDSGQWCAGVVPEFIRGGGNRTYIYKRLQQEYCYHRHRSLCCIQQGNGSMLPPLSWYEAHYTCSSQGGVIAAPGDDCVISLIRLQDDGVLFWSGLRTMELALRGEVTLDYPYTNWGLEEPSSQCVLVSDNGEWVTATCNDVETFFCEINDTTHSTEEALYPLTSTARTSVSSEEHSASSHGRTTVESTPAITGTGGEAVNESAAGQDSTGSKGTTIGIVVGVTVGVLILVAVAVVVIVFLVRRNNKPRNANPTNVANASYNIDQDHVTIADQTGYKSPEGDHAPVYAVPNKPYSEDVTVRDNSLYGNSDITNHVTADGELTDTEGGPPSTCPQVDDGGNLELKGAGMTVVDNELYVATETVQAGDNDTDTSVYSLEQPLPQEAQLERAAYSDDDGDSEDSDFVYVNQAVQNTRQKNSLA